MKAIKKISIIRPLNLALTFTAVLLGGYLFFLQGAPFHYLRVMIAAISACCVAAGAYMLNDVHDVVEDKINAANRAAPSEKLSAPLLLKTGWLFLVIGIIISFFLAMIQGLFVIIIVLLLLLYVYKLKSLPLIGNVVAALCAALTFPFGALADGAVSAGIIPALLAFPVHLAREIVKDVEDIKGDRAAGLVTLPILFSPEIAIRISGFIMIITAMVIPIPYFTGDLGLIYLLIAGILTAIPLAYWGGGAIAFPVNISSGKLQLGLKWIMLPGMAAILTGMMWN